MFKYKLSGETIPQDARQDINSKIEYIVNRGLSEAETGISKDDIFNAYTGKGGLHGLSFADYGSYYDYQKAKAEVEQGQFFTPYPLVSFIYDCLQISDTDLVADLTAGHGAFISCCPNETNFYACELDLQAFKVSQYLYPQAHLENGDIRVYEPGVKFDYVVGNPPYNLRWRKDGREYTSEMYYCLKAADLLKPAGIMAIIVPRAFCEDDFYNKWQIDALNEKFNFICQIELDKDTFKALGVTNYRTKIIFMQRKSDYLASRDFQPNQYVQGNSFFIWSHYLKEITEKRREIRQRIFLEMVRNDKNDREWTYKVEKLLYDIKRHPKTRIYYAECCEFLNQYKTQKKPEAVNVDEWEKMKLKPDDVIRKLKSALRKQNPRKSQHNRPIKDKYSVRYNTNSVTISDIILGIADYPPGFRDTSIMRLISQKKKDYIVQSQKFAEMKPDAEIAEFLDDFTLKSADDEIKLNQMQKHDINLILQKRYGFIQWEQGSGKTLAGIAIGKYRMEVQGARNVFVVSTAISIKNNWDDVLEQFGIPYRMINSLSDVAKIRQGEFIIITLNILTKYYKRLNRFVKQINRNATLIFDESDSISNMDSKRTKAVLSVFRKMRFKTLMTGTSTRNNIAEIYPQLELLYNNSVNMINECKVICERNREGEVETVENPHYMMPYPAYKQGFKLFTASHIPEKITVFGISQFNQDILNADKLKDIIDKTIITRSFEEVTGKNLYEIKQVTCQMGVAEKAVYEIALNEFYKMEYLFTKTGNARKDAMLKMLNQLLLLLKICAAPQTLREYNKKLLPLKFNTVLSLLADWSDERVAIGVRHISVVEAYEREIRHFFPNRDVFVITGKEATLKQRKKIIADLKKSKNGILISTQQSLSASMNIDFVDKCIVPELHWNNSSMSQYYFRFIRYTSTRFKTVVFVTYENSIESNLLKMVMVKDKLNLFMKSQDITDEELYDRFGVNSEMLRNLMYKEKTEDGYVIRWGNQEVS